jgi:hypothetical protein
VLNVSFALPCCTLSLLTTFFLSFRALDLLLLPHRQQFSYESNHEFDLSIEYPSGKIESKPVQKRGPHKFCLPESGVYKLTPTGCYRFAESTYTFDSAMVTPNTDIKFQAKEYRVQGSMHFEQRPSATQMAQCNVAVYATAEADQPKQVDTSLSLSLSVLCVCV